MVRPAVNPVLINKGSASRCHPITVIERIQRQIDRLLDKPEEAAALTDRQTALNRPEPVLTLDPQNEDAIAALGVAVRALGGSTPPSTTSPQHLRQISELDTELMAN